MNPNQTIHETVTLDQPAQRIWDRVSDHAQTHTWVLEARVKILTPGVPPPNGEGAVREVSFPAHKLWSTIHERVMSFVPGKSFTYKIISGMPGIRDHLGTVSLEAVDATHCQLAWHIDFEFIGWHPMGWISGSFTKTFRGVIRAALDELARQSKGG
jgi:hypothetical protein